MLQPNLNAQKPCEMCHTLCNSYHWSSCNDRFTLLPLTCHRSHVTPAVKAINSHPRPLDPAPLLSFSHQTPEKFQRTNQSARCAHDHISVGHTSIIIIPRVNQGFHPNALYDPAAKPQLLTIRKVSCRIKGFATLWIRRRLALADDPVATSWREQSEHPL